MQCRHARAKDKNNQIKRLREVARAVLRHSVLDYQMTEVLLLVNLLVTATKLAPPPQLTQLYWLPPLPLLKHRVAKVTEVNQKLRKTNKYKE